MKDPKQRLNQLLTSKKSKIRMCPDDEKKTRVRRLTPRECYRLQGFPDDYKIKVSDTQAYAQAGNAVTTTVIQAIANEINKTKVHSTFSQNK